MVVKIISEHISGKVGAIIHDGWSSYGVHYLGVFVSYELKKGKNSSEVGINCLSISPLHFSNDSDDDDEAKESVTFNSKSCMVNLKISFNNIGFSRLHPLLFFLNMIVSG